MPIQIQPRPWRRTRTRTWSRTRIRSQSTTLLACLPGCRRGCLVACLVACLAACLLACAPACVLAYFRAGWLACFLLRLLYCLRIVMEGSDLACGWLRSSMSTSNKIRIWIRVLSSLGLNSQVTFSLTWAFRVRLGLAFRSAPAAIHVDAEPASD